MKKWIVAFGACAALSTFPMGVFAHGYDAGNAALGGLVGGVVGGLIGAGGFPVYVAPAPVVVAPAPIVVAPYYAPAPVVVEPYGASPGYYRWHQRYYPTTPTTPVITIMTTIEGTDRCGTKPSHRSPAP